MYSNDSEQTQDKGEPGNEAKFFIYASYKQRHQEIGKGKKERPGF